MVVISVGCERKETSEEVARVNSPTSEEPTTQVAYVEPFDKDHVVTLWDSERSRKSCSQSTFDSLDTAIEISKIMKNVTHKLENGKSLKDPDVKRLLERQNYLKFKMMFPESACDAGDMGELTPGTKLEIVEPSDECGDTMNKVRVLQGKVDGRVGCVLVEDIALTPK